VLLTDISIGTGKFCSIRASDSVASKLALRPQEQKINATTACSASQHGGKAPRHPIYTERKRRMQPRRLALPSMTSETRKTINDSNRTKAWDEQADQTGRNPGRPLMSERKRLLCLLKCRPARVVRSSPTARPSKAGARSVGSQVPTSSAIPSSPHRAAAARSVGRPGRMSWRTQMPFPGFCLSALEAAYDDKRCGRRRLAETS
jgi:hypothetical protein